MNRSRFSAPHGADMGGGLPPVELWGVSQRDRKNTRRSRSTRVRERRALRRRARARGMTVKALMRQEGKR
jgi:hypothetical protein